MILVGLMKSFELNENLKLQINIKYYSLQIDINYRFMINNNLVSLNSIVKAEKGGEFVENRVSNKDEIRIILYIVLEEYIGVLIIYLRVEPEIFEVQKMVVVNRPWELSQVFLPIKILVIFKLEVKKANFIQVKQFLIHFLLYEGLKTVCPE